MLMSTSKNIRPSVDAGLVRRARRALNAPSDALAVRQALEEAIANREVEATLKALIRRGRHHFVDLESAGK